MNNTKILGLLLDNKEKKFTINQISKTLKINYRIAHKEVKKLEQEQLINTEKAGPSLLCSLKNRYDEKIYFAERQRLKKLEEKHKYFVTIRRRFEEAKQNYILLVFGSIAKGTSAKNSDIDLIAITEDKKEIEKITEFIPKNIHLTTTSYEMFIKMIKSKEFNVGNEVLKSNIILIGIEDYYRLLKNAGRT